MPQKMQFTVVVNDRKELPKLEVKQMKNCKYVRYGDDNQFPQYIWELYTHSSQFSSIVETMIDFIQGGGIVSQFPLKVVNRKGDTFDDFIERLVTDYILFGGFCAQITRNKLGNIAELNWIDFRNVRVNSDEDKIFYSEDWTNNRVQPKVYEKYSPNSKLPTSMLYYKGRRTRNQYPVPMYIGALTSLEITTEIPEYHLNNLVNGFHPSTIINFNNGSNLSEDVMDEIEESVNEKFCGVKNASKILLSFNDNTEHATTFERLPDDGSVDIYNTLAGTVEKDIYSAFRINKLLMGDGSENTGFNKQSYIESFAIYQKTVISPIQKEIEKVINNALGENSLHFEKFSIDWSETGADEDNSNIIE